MRWNYAGETALVDLYIMVAVSSKRLFFPVYAFMSWLLWVQAPYDIPILWLTLAGLISLPLVMLGPLSKLPVGAPASVWHSVLSRPFNINDWEYYGFMGIVFLAVVLQALNTLSIGIKSSNFGEKDGQRVTGRASPFTGSGQIQENINPFEDRDQQDQTC